MPLSAVTEKAWDKVRPSSVKTTGLSAAIRAFAKAVPGADFTALAGKTRFDAARTALEALGDAIREAEKAVAQRAADDKNGAAARLLAVWRKDAGDGLPALALARTSAGMAVLATVAASEFQDQEKQIDAAIEQARKLHIALLRGTTGAEVTASQAELLAMQKKLGDAATRATKAGFAAWAHTWPVVGLWDLDTKQAALPAQARALKTKVDTLGKLLIAVRDAMEDAMKQAGPGGARASRDVIQPMIDSLRGVNDELKAAARKVTAKLAEAKQLADGLKAGPIADTETAIADVVTLHWSLVRLEQATTAEMARVRVASGDLARQNQRGQTQADAVSAQAGKEYQKARAEWEGLCFASFRPCSAAFEATANQVNRALAAIAAAGNAKAAALPDALAKRRAAAVAKFS